MSSLDFRSSTFVFLIRFKALRPAPDVTTKLWWKIWSRRHAETNTLRLRQLVLVWRKGWTMLGWNPSRCQVESEEMAECTFYPKTAKSLVSKMMRLAKLQTPFAFCVTNTGTVGTFRHGHSAGPRSLVISGLASWHDTLFVWKTSCTKPGSLSLLLEMRQSGGSI